jgi:lysine-N-methylase
MSMMESISVQQDVNNAPMIDLKAKRSSISSARIFSALRASALKNRFTPW